MGIGIDLFSANITVIALGMSMGKNICLMLDMYVKKCNSFSFGIDLVALKRADFVLSIEDGHQIA